MIAYPAPQPGFNIGSFNPYYFLAGTTGLTLALGNARYLQLSGGALNGPLTITGNLDVSTITVAGSPLNLATITGITPGTATASKALVLDSSSNIVGINGLSASSITGTLVTVNQPNITSVGSLLGLTIVPSAHSFGTSLSSTGIIWWSTQDRYFGCRQIDTNNFSLLSRWNIRWLFRMDAFSYTNINYYWRTHY